MTFVSYAQNFEDVLLWRVFRTVENGFYIDIGAAHPDIDSVTRAFYDRGWHGINVEPVPEFFIRLEAARTRDVNLRVAVGQAASDGTVYVVAGTGLSTMDAALASQHRAGDMDVRAQDTAVTTLAEICRAHAPQTVHFLKVDVEGAEHAVLSGADFAACRPWVVLVEATEPGTTVENHQDWEPILLRADYRFVWFDGLNRFYIASEHYEALSLHFTVPVNIFDDFLRAADTELARRIQESEMRAAQAGLEKGVADLRLSHMAEQAADLLERSMIAEATVTIAEGRARDAEQLAYSTAMTAHAAEQRAHEASLRAHAADQHANQAAQQIRNQELRAQAAEQRTALAEQQAVQTHADLQRMYAALQHAQDEESWLRASTSWKLTAPLRGAVTTARGLTGRRTAASPPRAAIPPPGAAPAGVPPLPAIGVQAGVLQAGVLQSGALQGRAEAPRGETRHLRSVHQFHSGSAVGDAITNALIMIRGQLRAMGYRSEIYVEHRDPLLESELRLLAELPMHDGYVLILHHSMGFDAYERILALPAPKILMYHNITPPALFEGHPHIQHYARLGRHQLAGLRGQVVAALADSEYNAVELRRLGFEDAAACTLLFDLEAMRGRVRPRPERSQPFTILFVGRIVASKGQLDLLEAFAHLRRIDPRPSRLVLVGRFDGPGEGYAEAIRMRTHTLGLEAFVTLTGLVSDEDRDRHLGEADLFVSLSHHEGFGVPLVEAALGGLPVLAWPAGAVGYTLDEEAGLLHSRAPQDVAARIAELAADPQARASLAQAQLACVTRFETKLQHPVLNRALARAGAAAPENPSVGAVLTENMRFTVAGHVNKTYSLAAINRTLARSLEAARPGHVRLDAVEGAPTSALDDVPPEEREGVAALVARPPHETGPVVVISQHYPIYVPPDAGDALMAYVFWEESRLPSSMVATLNGGFRAVLAPSRFVAKVLQDSGVSVPVHVVGFAPELSAFAAPERRSGAGGPFTFLHVSSAFPRKGLDVLLAAYAQAFRAQDAVRLVVKTFPNPHNDAAAIIEGMRQADPLLPAIELIDSDVDAADLAALYADADAVVLPTRGEGFNLPAAEAMAAGKTLIVTGFGGHMDFCDETTARLVAFRLAPSRSHLATPLSLWAEPDRDDLTAALREAYDNPAGGSARARLGRDAAARHFDAGRFVARIEQAAIRTLLRPPARLPRICIVSSWGVRCGVAEYTRFLAEAMRSAEPDLPIVMLSDTRDAAADVSTAVRVRPGWTIGAPDSVATLRMAVAAEDPDVVLIQHQPGLLDWPSLGQAIAVLAVPHCVVAVTLHNTANLLDLDGTVRAEALCGLRLADRVIVHTLADVERLRGLGVLANVTLMPQGAPARLTAGPERTLGPTDQVTIGSCGFLLPDKGLPALVEAAGLLKARWPRIRLWLLNADYGNGLSEAEAARIGEAIAAAGLGGAAELVTDFLPFDEARRRLSECDVIVLPYPRSKEGSSAALRMALSTGRCVAVTPIDLFDDAEDAVYRLPGTDAAAIAEGLATLLSGDRERQGIRAAAEFWGVERGWGQIGARTLGLLTGLCNSAS